MMLVLWLVAGVFFVCFLLIVFRGAPYVPTHKRDVEALFGMHDFQSGEVLVDLGSGDGRVLSEAAKRGVRAVGYELNPFLVFYSRWRLSGEKNVSVKLQDFWGAKLPDGTAMVFVFLADPFMKKLDRKLTAEAQRLGHDIILVSYGMKIVGKTPEREQGGLLSYRYRTSLEA